VEIERSPGPWGAVRAVLGPMIAAMICAVLAAPAGATIVVPAPVQPQVVTPHAVTPPANSSPPMGSSPTAASSPDPSPPAQQSFGQSQASGSSSQSSAPASGSQGAAPATPSESSFPGADVPAGPGDPPFPADQPPHGSAECIDRSGCEQAWLDWAAARQQTLWVQAVTDKDANLKRDAHDLGRLADEIADEMVSVGQTPVDNLSGPAQKMPSAARPEMATSDATSSVVQVISDFLTDSDPDAVTASSLIDKAFAFLTGTTVCRNGTQPNGKVSLCKK
jgi:hypothetical protein